MWASTINILLAYFVFPGLPEKLGECPRFPFLSWLADPSDGDADGGRVGDGLQYLQESWWIKDAPVLREGAFRCQGAFRISITAGIFGATLVPVFAGLYMARLHRARAAVGIIAGLIITFTSNSSCPLMALGNGVVALGFWHFRANMRIVRWGAVVCILGLSLLMNAPVYYLIAKCGDLVGGDGWHRARLIEQFVNHSHEWWLGDH